MLADKGDTVPQDMMPDVLSCLLDCLAIHCTAKSALPLDRISSRYFHTLLRTMQAVVSQVKARLLIYGIMCMLSS